jgi:uncharacterized protein YbjT (DUF2867 family)
MTFTPFVWSSVFQQGLLLEKAGTDPITVIDTADIAAVGVLALTADGHEGQTYELTSDDHFTTVQLGEILSKALGKKLALFEGDEAALRSALVACGAPPEYAPVMSHYFETVADGRWRTTDTVSRLLGRKPGGYREWLTRNLPDILKVFKGAA